MVINSSNYGSSSKGALGYGGVRDWLVQRKTAVFLGLYFIYILYYIIANSPLEFTLWVSLFKPLTFKILTLIALICLVKHAWIGLWTIATDYISGYRLRISFLYLVKLSLMIYLIWGIYILWQV